MNNVPRRLFLKSSLAAAAAAGLRSRMIGQTNSVPAAPTSPGGFIIDTNVNIHAWPFRTLKHGQPGELAAKLQKHKIKQAWTGSFEALFHKNIDRVNQRLFADCRDHGKGVLVPFGTVNPAFPDWEEDLRRCHEVYKMPGIRLHPVYHGYTLEDPKFKELLDRASRRGLVVQIAATMEDDRMQHPLVDVRGADLTPLANVLKEVPNARVMTVNFHNLAYATAQNQMLRSLVEDSNVSFDISHMEGTAAVETALLSRPFLGGPPAHGSGQAPETKSGRGNSPRPPLPAIPIERLIFGSHAPYFPIENALFKLMESVLTRPQIDAVSHGNAARLLART